MKPLAKSHSSRYWIGYLLALFTLLLSACGGGGGSPGAITNQPTSTPTASVSSLVLTTSADKISASGAPGSEVTVTVLARDSRNVAVVGATISLQADSGAITLDVPTTTGSTPGVTDANGMVTAKLSIAGVTTPRLISIVASVGSVRSVVKTVEVIPATSVLTISASSTDLNSGGEITLSVLAKDSTNNVIKKAKVNITSTSGALTVGSAANGNTNLTDDNGMLTAKLTAGNDPRERVITVSAVLDASAGGSNTAKIDINVKTAAPSLKISTSSGNLDSAGAAGTEVAVVVLVRDANNNVVKGAPVVLAADSGSLTFGSRLTDEKGIVTEKLSTGNDPTARTIKVTASTTNTAGTQSDSTTVLVNGTQVVLNASTSVNAGKPTDMTVTVTDSSGKPIPNRPVEIKTNNGGLLVVKDNGPAVTSASGQLSLVFTGKTGTTSDTVTVKALGVAKSQAITVNNSNFTVAAQTAAIAPSLVPVVDINKCEAVKIHNDIGGVVQSGSVSLGVSRGAVYADSVCTTLFTGTKTLSAGEATLYVKAQNPGVAALVATLTTGVSTRGDIEFVAPLKSTANVTLQVDPGVIGVNTIDQSQRTVLKAVVRDGTIVNGVLVNNLVKDAVVNFSIEKDGSGGTLLQPSVVKTGADGSATVSYVSGPIATPTDGVQFKAQIVSSISSASGTANLTVGRQALFITAGTGNSIGTPADNLQTYIKSYQVLVTDAAGNPVSGANVTASVLPTHYRKGFLTFTNNFWQVITSATCINEDTNANGVLDVVLDEDINHNGRLEPGIPLTVTSGGQTDSSGATTVAIQYAKDQANWLAVDLTIRASVSGSEAKYVAHFTLVGASADYNAADKDPPGKLSPYGTGTVVNSLGKFPCEYTD